MMSEMEKTTHPIRGLLWGLLFGLGLSVVLVLLKVISLDLVQMLIVLVLGTIVGVLWGQFGPAKAPKEPPPSDLEPIVVDPAGEDASGVGVPSESATVSRDTDMTPTDTTEPWSSGFGPDDGTRSSGPDTGS